MIPANRIVLALALAVTSAAQERPEEDRIAGLIARLGVESQRQDAIANLVGMGRPAVEPLLRAMDRDVGPVLVGAIEALGDMGPHGAVAVPRLLRELESAPPGVAIAVLDALAGIAPWAPEFQPVLEGLADYRSEPSLTFLGTVPREDRKSLLDAFRLLEARTRVSDEFSTPELISILDRKHRMFESPGYRDSTDLWIEAAADVLGWRGQDATRALRSLALAYERYRMDPTVRATLMLHSPESLDRARIAERIGTAILQIGPESHQAIRIHIDRLTQGPPSVRMESIRALGRYGEEASSATPALIRCLERGDRALHSEAITALGMIGPGARGAIPILEELAGSEDPQIAARAKAALRQIKGDGR